MCGFCVKTAISWPPVSSYNVSGGCFLPSWLIWFWNRPLGMEIKRDRKKEGCRWIKSSMICFHRVHSSFIAWEIGFYFLSIYLLSSFDVFFILKNCNLFTKTSWIFYCDFVVKIDTYGDSLLKCWNLSSSNKKHALCLDWEWEFVLYKIYGIWFTGICWYKTVLKGILKDLHNTKKRARAWLRIMWRVSLKYKMVYLHY